MNVEYTFFVIKITKAQDYKREITSIFFHNYLLVVLLRSFNTIKLDMITLNIEYFLFY